MLNAKCRTALNDVFPIVTYVLTNASNAEKVGGTNPTPKQKQVIDGKKRAADHLKRTYDLVKEMYETDVSNQSSSSIRSELMEGVPKKEEKERVFFSKLFKKKEKNEGIIIDPDSIPVVSNTNIVASPMEDQWLELQQQDEEVETQYLDIISQNLSILGQFTVDFDRELERQNFLIEQVQGKTIKETQKIENLNGKVDDSNKMTAESRRCIYIIIFIIITLIVAFVLIKFVF